MNRLANKVAVITGSTSGIGRATAELFAKEGAQVVVNGRRRELGEQVVEGIRAAGGTASFFYGDVTKSDQIEAMIRFAVDTYGRLDILVNNAWSGRSAAVLDLSEEEWDYLFAVLLKASFLGAKYAIPEMIKGGGGSIINISSVHGLLSSHNYCAYDSAKAGVINLSRSIAVDYGHQGIRCNAICPGWIITEQTEKWVKEHPEHLRSAEMLYPVGRPGYTIDIAQAALFLASDESSFITGHALVVDGGLTIQLQDGVASMVERTVRQRLSGE
ncbi:MAG: glucose 1-dehydrogenase [Chloroflexi bacterium]|jgi:NAD(P)-dependent dehydrogenase (short-subunit alcohol dehydrogenase family)|nr:glucose 1-dehydrogenase [Chloroflexota bacterium]